MMKFALVGYGHIGKVHAQAIEQLDNAELVAVIDTAPIDLENVEHFEQIEDFFSSDVEADTIIIATPNGTHYSLAKKSLQAGFHTIVEKPITLNSTDLSDLIHLANNQNKRLFNMLQIRFSPVIQWVKKELIDSNVLGEIYMINTECYWNRNADYYQKRKWHGSIVEDGGVLFTQFSHFVDVLHYWFHKIKPKDIRSYNFNHQGLTEFADSGHIHFRIPDGGCGSLIYTTSVYQKNFDSNITIIAENGTVRISGQYMNQISYFDVKNMENPFDTEVGKHFHVNALDEVSSAISQNRESILDAHNAINVVRFLEVVS